MENRCKKSTKNKRNRLLKKFKINKTENSKRKQKKTDIKSNATS